ncbi:MAG: hypothetical protein EZS26_002618 [Candidatus Ordinivivax streblomastigis]|uniref:Uncharacterized protein n=1 Tax=Candidatus Ordinivivax streblomastigis TaxID=2540710 RepID=A0A5M8NYT1_9BACT|nr:MAG: hypothetical protein EZS26_002618 [Candidatus Ordinivivax streblomastigis]
MKFFEHVKEWLQLSNEDKLNCYAAISNKFDLPIMAIEKDWWVVHTLSLIFSMLYANALIFKNLIHPEISAQWYLNYLEINPIRTNP